MYLKMEIKNIKMIKDFEFCFPLESGLYAITGENGSGKSTIVTSASTVFFDMPMYDYFGRPNDDAYIKFDLNGATRTWKFTHINGSTKWESFSSKEKMKLNGFYEGSIVFGNRFKENVFSKIKVLDKMDLGDMQKADDFVVQNLGSILHDDNNYYSNLYVLKKSVAIKNEFKKDLYFMNIDDSLISQLRMSTGENLLISILSSLNRLRNKRLSNNLNSPCIVFLDEIELALHASALRRLVHFLKNIAEELNLSIFFSTHSLELIRDIKPQNIYYLNKLYNGEISVTNPCYPAFATRNLYNDDGHGLDVVIFVEDDVSQAIVQQIIENGNLIDGIRINVFPAGGWTNTLILAHDAISSHLILKDTKILIILDKDIQPLVNSFIKNHPSLKRSDLKYNFLPISSLEKFLKKNLIDQPNSTLYEKLNSYVFQGKPISKILEKYKKEVDVASDTDGKTLYNLLLEELHQIRKDREDLVRYVLKYLNTYEKESLHEISDFLKTNLR